MKAALKSVEELEAGVTPPAGAAEPVTSEPAANAPALVTERRGADVNVASMLMEVAQKTGRPPLEVMLEYAKLAFGPGRISFEEYINYGLYQAAQPEALNKAAFVGTKGMWFIWPALNFDPRWHGVLDNKLATEVMCRGFGIAVPETLAIFSTERTLTAPPLLKTKEALAQFLSEPAHFPLFGKPVNAIQSLGSASFERFDPATRELITTTGGRLALDGFVAEVATAYAGGYLLQARIQPHATVRALCGERTATVRLMTVAGANGPELLCGAWKIPAGGNVADNFWRPGNILAQLDLETGTILKAVTGAGFSRREVTTHPCTGTTLAGTAVPDWAKVKALVLDAARLFGEAGIIGWDVAATESGPMIVEANTTPDFALPQIANGKGLYDARMIQLIAERKAAAKRAKLDSRKANVSALKDQHTRMTFDFTKA